jgi:hypothetical protein
MSLGKMLKKKPMKISQGQMSGYFKGHENVITVSDQWGISESDMGFLDFESMMKDVEKSVDEWSKDVLPPNVKAQIDSQLKKESDKAIANVTKAATSEAQKLLSQKAKDPKVQDKAIASGIQAGAKAVEQASLDAAQAWREGGIKGVFEKFPVPFYVAGGLVGLMTLKWTLNQIGAGKAKAVLKSANPKRKIKKKSSKK